MGLETHDSMHGWPDPSDPASVKLFEQQVALEIVKSRSLSNQKLAVMAMIFAVLGLLLAGVALLEVMA